MDRRKFLATIGAGALPFAGCLAGGASDPSANRAETETPTSETTETTPPAAQSCVNGGEVVEEYEVSYDPFAGFDLTASKETVERGEQITFQLKNVTAGEKMTGVKSKYTIHRKTEAGWRDIFYPAEDSTGNPGYNDLGVSQPAGEGFTWDLTFSEDGLAHEIEEGSGPSTSVRRSGRARTGSCIGASSGTPRRVGTPRRSMRPASNFPFRMSRRTMGQRHVDCGGRRRGTQLTRGIDESDRHGVW